MAQRIIDLSLTIEDNMPAHKLFQRPVIALHMSHESTKSQNLGVSGDAMTFQTNFIAMLDHVGTHVDAYRKSIRKGHLSTRCRCKRSWEKRSASTCSIFRTWETLPLRTWKLRRKRPA